MTFNPYAVLRWNPHWTVVWDAPLPAGERGRWYPAAAVMLIRRGLTQRDRRSTVAHEVGHALAGDCQAEGRAGERQERRANDDAAHRLIPIGQLAEVLVWATNLTEAAEELHVADWLLQHRLEHLHPSERAVIRRRLAAADPTI